MALNIPCGVSGRARVVTTSSITGEVMQDTGEFQNIWTDLGINYLSGYSVKAVGWPSRILYGSGAHSEPHNGVTALAGYVGYGGAIYGSGDALAAELKITEDTCTFTRTRSITVPQRGVAWTLRELGLSYSDLKTLTYTLTKNSAGVPTPVEVSDIEIVTIYYTLQVTYPMQLPPQALEVEGLPPTTGVFKLKPLGSASSDGFLRVGPASTATFSAGDITAGFTNEAFSGSVDSSSTVGNARRFGINTLNRTTEFFGSNFYAANHIWQLSPPITKNNTQLLDIEEYWQFSNVPPVEVT